MWVSAWDSSGGSLGLEGSAVRLAAILYRVSPGFSSINARMYVRAAALYRRSPAFLGCFAQFGGDAVRSPMPRCHAVCIYVLHGEGCGLLLSVTTLFMFLLVNCFM